MPDRAEVLLVSKDKAIVQAVAKAVAPLAGVALGRTAHDLDHMASQMDRSPAPIVMVDIASRPTEMIAELERLIPDYPQTRFIILNDDLRNDLILEAMAIGVRYFLLQDSVTTNLPRILQKLIAEGSPSLDEPPDRGMVVTVLSSGGGAGATTLAVNLANELQGPGDAQSLLIDLDCAYGCIAAHLGLKGSYSVADVLDHDHTVDAALVRSSALSYSERLHVLLSPASVNFADPKQLQADKLPEALAACRLAYANTVIDAPRVPMNIASVLSANSDVTVICFQLTVKDVRIVRAMLAALKRAGIGTDRVLLLANRYKKRSPMISIVEGKEALGNLPIESIGNDYRSALRGIDFGQPLEQAAPRSILRKDFRRLASRVVHLSRSANEARK
jgi:pilus assembly protein CpaE